MKLGTYIIIASTALLTAFTAQNAEAQNSSWPPYQTLQPFYRHQGRIVRNNVCPIRIPENEVADPNDKVAIHQARKLMQQELEYGPPAFPVYDMNKEPRTAAPESYAQPPPNATTAAYPTEPEEKPEPTPVKNEPVAKTDASTKVPSYREKPVHVFGYSGNICKEQFVSEANSLLNDLFGLVKKDGKGDFYAYAQEKKGEIYTGIRDERDSVIADIHFPKKKAIDSKEFLFRLKKDLKDSKLGIDMDEYLTIVPRNHDGQCGH